MNSANGKLLANPQGALGVVQLILIVVFRVTQLVLIVDLKLFRGFGVLINFAYGRLIFTLVFVVTVVVVVFGTSRWRWDDAFERNIAHKIYSIYEIRSRSSNIGALAMGICRTASQSIGSKPVARIEVGRGGDSVSLKRYRYRDSECVAGL